MNKVTVFSSPNCPYCNQIKDYLNKNDVDYKEINLAQQPEKAEVLVKKSGQMGVPVTIVKKENGEEEVIIGFNPSKINQALGID